MSVISATLRTYSVLRDGTLRVVVDVDPRFKAEFHKLFVDIDLPVALAPLKPEFERIEQAEKQKGGELCKLAARWCKDPDFLGWLSAKADEISTEEEAAVYMRYMCCIDSRSELDHNPEAAALFNEHFRVPYMDFLKETNVQ